MPGNARDMTKVAKFKLHIYQGATFRKRLRWFMKSSGAAIYLTGCRARMQVRSDVESSVVLQELTTESGGITLGGIAGTVDLYISDEDTTAIKWEGGVFDVEIEHPSGEVTRLAEGSICVSLEVTCDDLVRCWRCAASLMCS